MGEHATPLLLQAGVVESLADGVGGDNLFESRQSIQDPARLVGR
jgi:hypothetical protein